MKDPTVRWTSLLFAIGQNNIALNTLAEASATELSKQRDPKGFNALKRVAKDGGSVTKAARKQLESKLGRSVISSAKASDYLLPGGEAGGSEEQVVT